MTLEILALFVEASRWATVSMDRDEWRAYGVERRLPADELPAAITPPWIVSEAERLERERRPIVIADRKPRDRTTEAARAYQRAYYQLRKARAAEDNRRRREAYQRNQAAAEAQRQRVRARYWAAKATGEGTS